jgi:hypothetical protein
MHYPQAHFKIVNTFCFFVLLSSFVILGSGCSAPKATRVVINARTQKVTINGSSNPSFTADADGMISVKVTEVANPFKTKWTFNQNKLVLFSDGTAFQKNLSSTLTIPSTTKPTGTEKQATGGLVDSLKSGQVGVTFNEKELAKHDEIDDAVTDLQKQVGDLRRALDFGDYQQTLISPDRVDLDRIQTNSRNEADLVLDVAVGTTKKNTSPTLVQRGDELYANSLEAFAKLRRLVSIHIANIKKEKGDVEKKLAGANKDLSSAQKKSAKSKKNKRQKNSAVKNAKAKIAQSNLALEPLRADSVIYEKWFSDITEGYNQLHTIGRDSIAKQMNTAAALYEQIVNQRDEVLFDLKQAVGDQMTFSIVPSPINAENFTDTFTLYIVKKPVIDFSTGVFFTKLGDDRFYLQKVDTLGPKRDSSVNYVKFDNSYNDGLRGVIPAELVNFHYRFDFWGGTQPIEFGLSGGLGLDLGTQKARYLGGLSIFFPAFSKRLQFTGGVIAGQVKQISPDVEQTKPYTGGADVATRDYFKTAFFVGIAYNL